MKGLILTVLILAAQAAEGASPNTRPPGTLQGEADEFSVSSAEAETRAKELFCGIAPKGCGPEKLHSTCTTAASPKGLSGFRCEVSLKEPPSERGVKALSLLLDKNLDFVSSARMARKPPMDPRYETPGSLKP